METKKVIEQENDYPIEIEIQKDGENDGVYIIQRVSGYNYSDIWINQENATEVAKAIDPKYQELEDEKNNYLRLVNEAIKENAKLLEAKDKEMIEFAWWFFTNLGRYADDQVAHFEGAYLEEWKKIQAIQQSKSKDNE